MTEDEAKTKWCPFANVYVPYGHTGAAGNRALDKSERAQGWEGNARCIGSACMAWRRLKKYEFVKGTDDVKPDGDGWEWDTLSDNGWERWIVSLDGYCGLAGKLE